MLLFDLLFLPESGSTVRSTNLTLRLRLVFAKVRERPRTKFILRLRLEFIKYFRPPARLRQVLSV